jgi:hypothetical protein
MTRKNLGYVELEWTCPNCGNKNPGMQKSCGTCGAPQPANVQFELGQKQDLIQDAQKAAEAAKGADIHCPYCNTRNAADAKVCVQCGGDLVEGTKRESGKVLSGSSATANAEIKCPGCGTVNPPGSATCKACGASLSAATPPQPVATQAAGAKKSAFRPWMALPMVAVLAMCCLVVGFLFFRTTSLTGTVQNTQWQRTIDIEAQREVTKEAWRDEVPAGADAFSCSERYRTRQDSPTANSKEVCATELVDQGNGAAEVVEKCYYEVYDDYCQYKALEWQKVDQALAQGTDLQPYWPQVNLAGDQREGNRTENYTVDFNTKDGTKQFTTTDESLYIQFEPDSLWTLKVNTIGSVMDVSR